MLKVILSVLAQAGYIKIDKNKLTIGSNRINNKSVNLSNSIKMEKNFRADFFISETSLAFIQ